MPLLDAKSPLRFSGDLGGPLLGPQSPRSGRVLSRGSFGRATEPLRWVSAHSGYARYRDTTRRSASRPFAVVRARMTSGVSPHLCGLDRRSHRGDGLPSRSVAPLNGGLARQAIRDICRTALPRLGVIIVTPMPVSTLSWSWAAIS